MSVPRNVSSLLSKISGAKPKAKPVVKPKETPVEEPIEQRPDSGREAAKLRQRAKKAESELASITLERDTLKLENEQLKPKAKLWDDHDHIQRSKIIETLPAELRKEAKSMPLNHLQILSKNIGGNGANNGAGNKADDLSKETDLLKLQKSGDRKAINDYVEKVKKGEIVPTQPVAADPLKA